MCLWKCLSIQSNVSKGGTQGRIKNKLAFKRRKNFPKQMLFVRNHSSQTNDLLFSKLLAEAIWHGLAGEIHLSEMAQETGAHSLYSDIFSFLFEYRAQATWKCIGFEWHGLGWGNLEVAAVSSCQKPVFNRANANWLQDGPAADQGWAHPWQWQCLWDNVF